MAPLQASSHQIVAPNKPSPLKGTLRAFPAGRPDTEQIGRGSSAQIMARGTSAPPDAWSLGSTHGREEILRQQQTAHPPAGG